MHPDQSLQRRSFYKIKALGFAFAYLYTQMGTATINMQFECSCLQPLHTAGLTCVFMLKRDSAVDVRTGRIKND